MTKQQLPTLKIEKKWREDEEKLRTEGEPLDWFPTTPEECLRHTEGAGHWKMGSVLQMLLDGQIVFTPYSEYRSVQLKEASNGR